MKQLGESFSEGLLSETSRQITWAKWVRRGVDRRLHRFLDRSFDRRIGVRTSGIRVVGELGIPDESAPHAVDYEPTPTILFRRMLGALSVHFQQFVFVDLGSGMGRTLLMAAEFPLRRIEEVRNCRERSTAF